MMGWPSVVKCGQVPGFESSCSIWNVQKITETKKNISINYIGPLVDPIW